MLEGIEILNQTEIMTAPTWAGVICFIYTCLAIISWIFYIIKDNVVMLTLLIISFLLAIIFMFLMLGIDVPTGKYDYQVTIDDSVLMVEFTEKYEIVEINGKIYTIREKE